MVDEKLLTDLMHSKAAWIALGSLAIAVLAGCIMGPRRAAYTALDASAISATHAIQVWGDYVAQFHPPVDQEAAVQRAYDKYEALELEAIDAAKVTISLNASGNTNALIGANSKAAQSHAAASQALSDLVALIRSFNVNL